MSKEDIPDTFIRKPAKIMTALRPMAAASPAEGGAPNMGVT